MSYAARLIDVNAQQAAFPAPRSWTSTISIPEPGQPFRDLRDPFDDSVFSTAGIVILPNKKVGFRPLRSALTFLLDHKTQPNAHSRHRGCASRQG